MEYVAFLFLGLGVLLVLAGALLQVNANRPSEKSALDDYVRQSENSSMFKDAPFKPVGSISLATPHVSAPAEQWSNAATPGQTVPGPFQFVQNKPTPPKEDFAPSPVAVSVQKNNPRLFEKFAYLYLDSSTKNVYDGAGSVAAFDLSEVAGIRRFGRGVFSYDGFGFFFDHQSGQERFPLTNLKTVGFYPNCVALTFRTNQPVALLFMEETESIRKVLETFRATNAT